MEARYCQLATRSLGVKEDTELYCRTRETCALHTEKGMLSLDVDGGEQTREFEQRADHPEAIYGIKIRYISHR
jgi:hypothetical protein